MCRRALSPLALAFVALLLATGASAQEASRGGTHVRVGVAAPEALLFDGPSTTLGAGYRWASGARLSLSVGTSQTEETRINVRPYGIVLGIPASGLSRRESAVGIGGGVVLRREQTALELHGTARYGYVRATLTQYAIDSTGAQRPGGTVGLYTESVRSAAAHRLQVGASATASRTVEAIGGLRLRPGLGVSVGAQPTLSGARDSFDAAAAVFFTLPASLRLGDTSALTLEGTYGLALRTGLGNNVSRLAPTVGVAASVDF